MTKRRDRGSGGIYQRASDGKWVAAITLPSDPITGTRRRKVVTAASKTEAQRKAGELRKSLEESGDLLTKSPTVAQWMHTWLTTITPGRLKPSTQEEYESKVRLYVLPRIGKKRLEKVTPTMVAGIYQWMTTSTDAYVPGLGLSSTTALQVHAILTKSLTDAKRRGQVTRNVAELVDPPQKAATERDPLTADEAIRFLKVNAADPYVARYALGLMTGCRQGEALGLTCDNVQIDRDDDGEIVGGLVTLAWNLQRVKWRHGCPLKRPCGRKRAAECPQRHMEVEEGPDAKHEDGALWRLRPKTKMSYREVPLPKMLATILDRVKGDRDAGLMFTEGGKAIDPRRDWGTWKAWLERAELPPVSVHVMRHTTSTLLYAMGVDEQTRMAILGHSSATTTRGYTHRDLTLERAAMKQMEDALSQALPELGAGGR